MRCSILSSLSLKHIKGTRLATAAGNFDKKGECGELCLYVLLADEVRHSISKDFKIVNG
jgi:hypothetical protein